MICEECQQEFDESEGRITEDIFLCDDCNEKEIK